MRDKDLTLEEVEENVHHEKSRAVNLSINALAMKLDDFLDFIRQLKFDYENGKTFWPESCDSEDLN